MVQTPPFWHLTHREPDLDWILRRDVGAGLQRLVASGLPIRRVGWDVWREQMAVAAARPNVMAKISGLDTAAGPGWTAEELRPSVEVALDAFGPDRLLFGTDWPVCRMVSTYAEVVSATEALIGGLSPDERAAIMGGTARRVYGLP